MEAGTGGQTNQVDKALAALTKQMAKQTEELQKLKRATPSLDPKPRQKGTKAPRAGVRKIVCAHPDCGGEHSLKDCPLMKGLPKPEFQRLYKAHLDAYFKKLKQSKVRWMASPVMETWCLHSDRECRIR